MDYRPDEIAPSVGARYIPDELTPPLPETEGYSLTHTMLYINEPSASLRFYRDYLGMSVVFVQNTGPFTLYYLAYPSATDSRPSDIARDLASRRGLLELVHVHAMSDDTGEERVKSQRHRVGGFGHLGFVVTDVEQAVERAKAAGFQVSGGGSDVLERTMPGLPGCVPEGSFHHGFKRIYAQLSFVCDPDGYWIELLPTVWK